MPKLATMTLTGASGKTYTFDVYPADANWAEDIACVYYVSKRTKKSDGSGTHGAIYIGETEDLENRHVDHHKQECFKNHGYNCISIHHESNPRARIQVEEDLVKALDPPCNG
jgi:hypothetical protein